MIERFAEETSQYLWLVETPPPIPVQVSAKLQMEIRLETFNIFQTNFAVYQHQHPTEIKF